ncbi:unnamed protein product [Prorocentrum cordatum]|uniref:Sugar phosphate transporter domain-containing protein n=2 Tax=Prorocentrum cordatum TaxID=2364126 RepID=A0ABN9R4Z0_9DINO|nr:unnamed protein product [Polarella glacialis]
MRDIDQTGNGKDMFPYIILAGFFVVVVLHTLVNHMRDYLRHGGAPPAPAEGGEADSGKQLAGTPEASVHHGLRERLEAFLWVLCWMVCSATFVIYNKWLFTKGGFPHPIYLTTFHMAVCFVAFWFVRIAAPVAVRDSIMPDAEKVIPWDTYLYCLLPISVLYGYCLGAGNLAFMFSSVAFLQMVKPINVLFTSLAAFAFGLETATMTHVVIVCIICGGVSLAASGDVEFSLIGCMLQLTACTCEGIRLALLQKVMTKDLKLDPVTTVYRFAPVAGLSLCLVAVFVEKPVDWGRLKSPPMLFMNCVVALVLNVLIVTVIKKASAVVFTLAGILKDVGAIAASVVIFQTPIAPLEVMGYGLSVCGISMFKCYKDNIQTFKSEGFFGGFHRVLTGSKSAASGR